ncbi:MAG: 2-hydroxy-acid oxidase, partial [Rhodospirillales bacterium]|nr:2-hydroxy-acid oxidase [Rhodospirillales bacterium]
IGAFRAATAFYDRGGGQVWLVTAEGGEAGAPVIRAAAAKVGGAATLVRAADAVRAAVGAFHPQPAALFKLSQRVKEAFDPRRLLSPGRLYEGL